MTRPLIVVLLTCAARLAGAGAIDRPDYTLRVDFADAVSAGKATDYLLSITPKGKWVLKTETPFKVTLAPSGGVQVGKSELTAKDFLDAAAATKGVRTNVTAPAGKHSISAKVEFFLCSEELCKRFTDSAEHGFSAR